MNFNIGDLVTRKSYDNDTVFKIINIEDDIAYLKGVNIRLYADSDIDDLVLYNKKEKELIESDNRQFKGVKVVGKLNRDEYFYLPGKILHIDTDIHLSNNHSNPYKIRKKAKIQKYINHQKKQKMSKI